MEYSPPPLFKQGAPARVKVTVFAFISIVLLMVDSRLEVLKSVRAVTATVLYPLQMAALVPRDALSGMGGYFSSVSTLQKEVRELRIAQVATAQTVQQAQYQMAENIQLRKLLGARDHLPVASMMTEILYDARDSSTRKIVIDRGTQRNVRLGLPVIDGSGVVGQVTRVFPFTSEVTLLTDKEQAIPVQVLRNGLRSVAYGRGQSGLLDLRFVAPNADILVGDVLITSGMDGVYPAGLAVAKVIKVENSAAGAFGGVLCQPLAGIDRHRHLLVLMDAPQLPPRPPEDSTKPIKKSALQKMTPIAAPTAAGAVPAPVAGLTPPPVAGIRPAPPAPAQPLKEPAK
ncbi:MAG: rod shape-determining protein MreC [Pseudomonadota bacterium]